VYEAADAAGRNMTLRDALAYAIEALNEPFARARGGSPDRLGRALVTNGSSDGEIADVLFISKKTAAVHVANIKGKLGAKSRVDIVGLAVRHGLVELSRQA
jgi:ABC-type enterobactin transport system permease subunit